MPLIELIVTGLLFVLSSGILFNDQHRRNKLLVGIAAVLTIGSTISLLAALSNRRSNDTSTDSVSVNTDTTAPRLISSTHAPEVRALANGDYTLALPQPLWDAVNAYLRPRDAIRLATWSDASKDGKAAMRQGQLQYPFALWRDLDGDGDLDIALVFVSEKRTNSFAWRDWNVVVFRQWPDGRFQDLPVTTMNGSCFDGMIYVPEFDHVEYGCFEVAVGSFRWAGHGFFIDGGIGD
ncbi:MAG TPA: hypothetical protein VF647_17905 [Longimicrobium sp.]|jgi:hypothetical protein